MNVSQAIELASSLFIPEFLFADGVGAVEAEREKTEEAIRTLKDDWFSQPAGKESFSFDLVRELADRNRTLCDLEETSDDPSAQAIAQRREDSTGMNLARSLSEADLVNGVAALQRRSTKKVAREVGGDLNNLGIAYVSAPVKGTVVGIDLETTGRNPDRGYIINVGWQVMDLTPTAKPTGDTAVYCGLPPAWAGRPVPLERIHHITPDMLAGKKPFREDKDLQKRLLKLLRSHPFMAHNAAFEDSWLTLFLDGYAEGRKAGKIIPIDTRDICRRVDIDMRSLPRESHPATLENWARRRGTLSTDESEQHLGLDDTDLMLRTVQAEFSLRNMFSDGPAPAAKAEAPAVKPKPEPKPAVEPAAEPAGTQGEKPAALAQPTKPAAAAQLTASQAAARDQLARALLVPLSRISRDGADSLAAWSHDWLVRATSQLPAPLAAQARVGDVDASGFVASLHGSDAAADPVVLQAKLLGLPDQTELAGALARYACALAEAAATGKLPAGTVRLACYR